MSAFLKKYWLLFVGLIGMVVGVCIGSLGFHDIAVWVGGAGLAAVGGHAVKGQNGEIASTKQSVVDQSVQSAERLSATNTDRAQDPTGSGTGADPDAEILAKAERLSGSNQNAISGSGNSGSKPGG